MGPMMPSTRNSAPLLRLVGVDAHYASDPVLRRVDLTVEAGSFIGVVGPSGSGKTTLLRLLLGALRPSGGRIERREPMSVGYVPQLETIDWNFPITVRECVLMARRQTRLWPGPTCAERAAVVDVLERLGIGHVAHRRIRELSGGQQQRVFLARALVQRPDLLLLDEPTSGLDVATRHEILHLLAGLRRDGLTVLLTTHDLNGIANHLPELVCLNRRVIAAGPPSVVFTPYVLERTFGAPMAVLRHSGLLLVVDDATVPAEPPLSKGAA